MTAPNQTNLSREHEVAVTAVRAAAAAIRTFYDAMNAEIYTKSDESPVTDADLASDRHHSGASGGRVPGRCDSDRRSGR